MAAGKEIIVRAALELVKVLADEAPAVNDHDFSWACLSIDVKSVFLTLSIDDFHLAPEQGQNFPDAETAKAHRRGERLVLERACLAALWPLTPYEREMATQQAEEHLGAIARELFYQKYPERRP